jgi:hypothetical protein
MAKASKPFLSKQLALLKKEVALLEKNLDNPSTGSTGQYRFDISISTATKKAKVTVYGDKGSDVTTCSCATACGTCMADSCYSC